MREYTVLISHVQRDKDKALMLAERINNASFEFRGEYVKMTAVYMESSENGCFGDFLVWSENAVLSSDCVLAIISQNTVAKTGEVNGADVNHKIVYDEISLAKETSKDIMLVRDSRLSELESGYRILFQNISAEYYTDSLTESDYQNIINKLVSFAKARLSGSPILTYAGKNEATLSEYAIGDSKIFLGRIAELETMDILFDRKNTICISGFGGIGKTTLAKMYAIKHPELALSVYYCTEESTLKNVITKLVSDNVEQISIDKCDQQPILKYNEEYRRAITHLSKIHKPTLIIIDNFNFDFTGKDNNRVFDDVSTLTNCKFIITTRNANIQRQDVGIIDIEKMDDNSLFELFYRDSHLQRSDENDRIISKLIEITEGHTMTIELVARAIGNDVSGLTPAEILDTMLDENSAETRLEDNARFDDFGEYDTIYNHLNKLFDLAHLSDTQKHLLGCLSFVPTNGLTAQEIKHLVKELSPDELRYLVRLGYVQATDHTPYSYYLHPLISELSFGKFTERLDKNLQMALFVIFRKIEPISKDPEANHADLKCAYGYASFLAERLKHLIDKGELSALLYRDKLLIVDEYIAHIQYCLFNFEDSMNYYKKVASDAQDLIGHLPDKLKYQETMLRNAINYARLCVILGKETESKFHLNQCIEITEEILKNLTEMDYTPDEMKNKRRDIANRYVDLGYLYRQLGDLEKACEYYNKSIEIYVRLGWDGTVANIETILGYIQTDMGNFAEAEITFKCAMDRTKALADSKKTVQAKIKHAKSAIDLAFLYSTYEDLSKALLWYEYALNRLTELYQDSPTLQVKRELINAQTNVADIHVNQKKPRIALKELKIAVDMALEVYIETDLERDLDTLNECLVKYEWTRCLNGGLIMRFINGCRIVSSKRLYAYKIYQNIDADYDKYCLKVYDRLAYATKNNRIKWVLESARDDIAERIAQKEKQNKKK